MRLFYLLTLSLGLALSGCKSKPPTVNADGAVTQKIVDSAVREQISSTATIRQEADKAEAKAPEVQPEMTAIREETVKIDTNAQAIQDAHATFNDAITKEAATLAKEKAALANKVKDLEDKNNAQQKRILSLIIIGSMLTVAVSIALMFLGNLRSITLTVIAGSVLLGAITLQFLMAYALWIGLAVTLIIGFFVVYKVWLNKKGLIEVIWTAEEAKKKIGKDEFAAIAANEQSNSTVQIVKQIRDKEGLSSDANV